MSELKHAGIMMQMAYQGMASLGIDTMEVLRRVGVSFKQYEEKDFRFSHDVMEIIVNHAIDVSGDPDFGLHVGQHLPAFRGQVLEYLFLSSSTFGDGLVRAIKYQRLLSDVTKTNLEIEEDLAYLVDDSAMQEIIHISVCGALTILKFFDYITDGAFQLVKIHFIAPEPKDISEYEKVFGCQLLFGQKETRIYFPESNLHIHSLHAAPELLQLHEKLASEQLSNLEKDDFVGRVNWVIGELLESGIVNLEAVSAKLDMKPRAVRARLTEAGTNFNQLVTDYRCNLAKNLLLKTDESIDEIVYLTGFSEPSTFYRAFKRWTDFNPVEYRKTQGILVPA